MQRLAGMKGVVSVFPSRTFRVQTTRSWDFIGLPENISRNPTSDRLSDTIVGVIDTGIWPESASFSDEGFGPAPKKWKGKCAGGRNFTCNNKIIGARFYSSRGSADSARDDTGHGSHTASTAAGSKVKDANFYGLAKGIARGGVSSARIAAYKACNADGGCEGVDILAAFDDAIADGVDILTVSLGSDAPIDVSVDEIAIGSFHAMQNGILTVNSAGNSGPKVRSVSSVAPWMLSIAASSTDRKFIDKVVLGNGKTLLGSSINSFNLKRKKFPLVYGSQATSLCSEVGARSCSEFCINSTLVKGKIVLCDNFNGNSEVHRAGALGTILRASQFDNIAFVVPLPASALTSEDYSLVTSYLRSTKSPEASILKSEVITDSTAPVVASFSSRGPNAIAPDIMKPDVSAPGVDILAAYIPVVSPSSGDRRRVEYNILSGTSMSCPHAAAVAAYVKAFHPDWSPSAIKSAIMTTALPMNATNNPDAEFAYGSGHINPLKAVQPGLVYETLKDDYVKLLCSMGYDTGSVRGITGDNSSCPKGSDEASLKDFNYPSLTSRVSIGESFRVKFHRTVKNVGPAKSTYQAIIYPKSELNITVKPPVLSFQSKNEKQSFDVTVAGRSLQVGAMVSTSLVWSDGTRRVRSPIIVHAK
ncbi:hypothetical protein MANES_01G167604v8 [Manihot esculenta]|uniref:Uncharacterized protein n=2 Tax=Manihot esculenta TaxID=3983 RepID=A0ACB7IID5_MANES|nr:hypothetical protein MANES_01G167604v8 [Manihot esculenta]